MLATHPLTGQPIRILKTAPTIYSDAKTLVWLRAGFEASARWGRWHIAISEPTAVGLCETSTVSIVLLDGDAKPADWASVFPCLFGPTSSTLLVGPSAVLSAFEDAGLKCDRSLITEDLYDAFPYLGEPLAVKDGLAKVVVAIAHILRMQRIAWSEPTDRTAVTFGVRAMLDAWGRACCDGGVPSLLGLSATANDRVIPRCWLIQQYYEDASHRRAREIRTCLEKNLACDYVDRVLLLNEKAYDLPASPKLQTVILGHRLRYYDVFQAIRAHVPAGDFVVFANSDIWLDTTLSYLWKIPLAEKRLFLALLRWEDEDPPRIFGPRADSQDAWMLARDSVDFVPEEADLGFPFGKPGCDNAIALSMMRKRFLIVNPAYSIKTRHLHSSAVRRYNPQDVLYRPQYLYVEPSAIQGFHVVADMKDKKYAVPEATLKAWHTLRLGASFARPLLCDNAGDLATVCSSLRRSGWSFSGNDANLWTPPPGGAPFYHLAGGHFVSSEGLVWNCREIFTGGHSGWSSAWESAPLSALMPCVHAPALVALPFKQEWSRDLCAWILHYLPRALAVRFAVSAGGGAPPEFFVPQHPNIGAFLADCVWADGDARGNITVVPYMEEMNYYADQVWAVPPVEDVGLPTKEDVARLRALLPVAPKYNGGSVAVFCVEDTEDAVCTRAWAESVADNLFHTGWTVRYVGAEDLPSVRRKAFSDASWIFGAGEGLSWIWMAGAGATVMEFLSDSEPRGDIVHLAGACGLRYITGVVKREPIVHQRQNALLAIASALPKYGYRELVSSPATTDTKPVVILPCGGALSGIWAHTGDTFREMAELWAERGYVRLERREDTPYCWWGGVGQTLLYDRPTARWWGSPPSYQMALFGNCAPPGPGPHLLKQSVWSFWGRRPRLLEGIATRVENMRGFESRPIQSLFLGKIENGVQHAGRTGADWASAVELFSMPIDSTGKPYPFNAEQYLEKLCSARYGLCLPGYGPKCNREIEYFCCGTVPIVTPGVDMKGYLVPPREGVHYFTAGSPAEVRRIVETTSAERWATMSAAGREWWRLYASAEGFYRLTAARIEQCQPFLHVGIPPKFIV